ncbi:metalloendopeptidase-like membrane protein [Owenweeksia hongkongensis DSM 17368]|uniref:Metalloendopeptidase-like membrane protein n=1 Tax=Owenweeksia hongkongensis (strain DSM 17368 / CIP 108786 / JCM 12287 / NRRL B-23963 / UST20020801) TaxID=926562 RepID=G8R1S7_OWEHD|nr:M23 family metallopeptidase [Owenweeksia hongkongensis]AEV32853.1 metalloendopeptidase-like membrane protein [Owenweeksia hongkongensis DSM 17368]
MAKVKYYYDPKTLSYRKIEKGTRYKIRNTAIFLASSALMGALFYLVADNFINSPKEKRLHREVENMKIQYDILNGKMNQAVAVLEGLQKRDDDIYRVIFEAEPIPNTIRKAGFGGANRYKKLEGFDNSELIKETAQRMDQITKEIYVQSRSFDEIVDMAEDKTKLLAAIPAIQPVANKDLKRMASGFGLRVDPFTKARKMHNGMDFSAQIGTPVYATGDGKVIRADNRASGFGNHIRIDHGYGYTTVYAHLNEYNVRKGQKVKRGEIIGFVGNTGRSRGPHLHYEVWLNDDKLNPVNFYYGELSPEEFSTIIQMSSQPNQSFD